MPLTSSTLWLKQSKIARSNMYIWPGTPGVKNIVYTRTPTEHVKICKNVCKKEYLCQKRPKFAPDPLYFFF